MVPAAEFLADVLHAHAGDLTQYVDGGAAGGGDIAVALGAADVGGAHVVGAAHLADDLLDGDGHRLGLVQNILDGILGHADHRFDAFQHVVGVQLLDRALQLPDVVLQMVRDELGHIVGDVQPQQFRLAPDDGHPGLKIGRLDIGGQAPLEPGAQTFLQALDLLGGTVAGQHDLLVGLVQGVEGVEELLLGALLARDELDIVHQQHVGLPVLVPELLGGAGPDGGDDLVGELFTGNVDNVEIRMVLADLDLDGVQQVGLAQTALAVDEQRIVGAGGVRGHRLGGGVGELVGRALDEVLKGELVFAAGQLVRLGRGRGGAAVPLGSGNRRGGRAVGGHHQVDQHVKTQHGFKGLFQHGKIPLPHDLADEVVAHPQGHLTGTLKADRLQPGNVQVVGGVHHALLAVGLCGLEYVVERIHRRLHSLQFSPCAPAGPAFFMQCHMDLSYHKMTVRAIKNRPLK